MRVAFSASSISPRPSACNAVSKPECTPNRQNRYYQDEEGRASVCDARPFRIDGGGPSSSWVGFATPGQRIPDCGALVPEPRGRWTTLKLTATRAVSERFGPTSWGSHAGNTTSRLRTGA
jgi:hypothetical protein